MEGYKYLGYQNDWPVIGREGFVAIIQLPKEYEECRAKGHKLQGTSTRYGQHHYWCPECKIEWRCDSGD